MHTAAHDPRAQAKRCRRIAKYISDEAVKQRLEMLADEYEAQLSGGAAGFMLRDPGGRDGSGSGERA